MPRISSRPSRGKKFHEAFAAGGDTAKKAAIELVATFAQGKIDPALNYQPGNPAYKRVWDDLIQAAEEFNEPHRFTTFIAYEWTSLVTGNNLHRNVIFRDGPERAGQIVPYSTTPPVGSPNPQDLWKWLQNYEDTTGGDVLAIPHNGNLSNGMMFALQDDFADGKALDTDYAVTRQKWERLYEASQIKGDGEAHPMLSPDDEFADFETWDWGNLDASEKKTAAMLPAEYARSGLKSGLELEKKLGTNPFKFGMVGASDTHTGLSTPDNDNFYGKFTAYEPNDHRATHMAKGEQGTRYLLQELALHHRRSYSRVGQREHPAPRSSMPWSAAKSTLPLAPGCGFASLEGSTFRRKTQTAVTSLFSATAKACQWAAT